MNIVSKKNLELLIFIIALALLSWAGFNYFTKNLEEKISTEISFNHSDDPKLILLVPGHDHESYGGKFRELKEEQLTRELAREIAKLLEADGRFKIVTTRDFETGDYTDEFSDFFASSETQIIHFKESAKKAMSALLATGGIVREEAVIEHNLVTADTGFRLYGINKWANDKKIDLALHIHFNDYPRDDMKVVGKYVGFAMYVPEDQFGNSQTSQDIAQKLYNSLDNVTATSTFPLESGGIIKSQDLIAVGANNSQTHPAVLVEYGYMYEPDYYIADRRTKSLPRLARATHKGLVDYFYKK